MKHTAHVYSWRRTWFGSHAHVSRTLELVTLSETRNWPPTNFSHRQNLLLQELTDKSRHNTLRLTSTVPTAPPCEPRALRVSAVRQSELCPQRGRRRRRRRGERGGASQTGLRLPESQFPVRAFLHVKTGIHALYLRLAHVQTPPGPRLSAGSPASPVWTLTWGETHTNLRGIFRQRPARISNIHVSVGD